MSTPEEIGALFHKWKDALATADYKEVVKLYAPDAVLLPTLSNQVRHNHEEIGDYFESFCARRPIASMVESNIRVTDQLASNAGIYRFNLDAEDGTRVSVNVRFSFTYERRPSASGGDDWIIVAHHSSVMPEGD